jgi:3'(2'), 5'-bisphosphate nucleotidase
MEATVNEPQPHRASANRTLIEPGLWEALTAAVARAAVATLAARSNLAVRRKADHSPVTDADERSQAILLDAVAGLMPGVVSVAEEMAAPPPRLGEVFVLIDPLDGTKEYISGSSEYTVNLGIVHNRTPIAGILAVPACGLIYRGIVGTGAERLAMTAEGAIASHAGASAIAIRAAPPAAALMAAVSRSHLDDATVALLDRLGVTGRVPCGSALKFCRVAEGTADIYPRLAPTCEWDVAAGHALVAAAGGLVTLPDGGALGYGDAASNFRIAAFIAWGDRAGALRRSS